MNTDIKEKDDINPVIQFLEDNDALELLAEDSSLYPQILGQCEFTRVGFNTVGIYTNEQAGIEIKYEILPYSKDVKKLECTVIAPIRRWKRWETKFPGDFSLAIISNSPYFQVNSNLPVILFQEFIPENGKLIKHVAVGATVSNELQTIDIYKLGSKPTKAYYSDQWGIRRYPISKEISRQQ